MVFKDVCSEFSGASLNRLLLSRHWRPAATLAACWGGSRPSRSSNSGEVYLNFPFCRLSQKCNLKRFLALICSEVKSCFVTCILDSEFRACFIKALKQCPFWIKSFLKVYVKNAEKCGDSPNRGGSPRTKLYFWKKSFCRDHIGPFLDTINMFYTWSPPPMPLQKLFMWCSVWVPVPRW